MPYGAVTVVIRPVTDGSRGTLRRAPTRCYSFLEPSGSRSFVTGSARVVGAGIGVSVDAFMGIVLVVTGQGNERHGDPSDQGGLPTLGSSQRLRTNAGTGVAA